MKPSVNDIHHCLPKTQCQECGFAGCLPYAQALHAQQSTIDRCPPGGVQTLEALGALLNIDPSPYRDTLAARTRAPRVARIDEKHCIGCVKCIQACPVDAILGTAQHMHTVISDECTGCGLCVEPCPMNCIELTPIDAPHYDPALAQQRFDAKQQRLLQAQQQKEAQYQQKRQLASASDNAQAERLAKKNYILKALQRKTVPHE